jgi:DNA-binding CsgD family transcriptional regulator
MKTLISAYIIICYSINLVSLCLLGLVYLRRPHTLYRQELLFMLGMMTISFTLSMPSLFAPPGPADVPGILDYLLCSLLLAGICLVAAATPAYIHSFRPTRLGRTISRLCLLASGVLLVASLTELILTGSTYLINACFSLMLASVAWSAAWFFRQVWRHRDLVRHSPSARVTLTMCILTVFFMPLIVMVDFLNLSLPFLPHGPGPRLVFVPLFLAIWSVLLLRKNAPIVAGAAAADALDRLPGAAPPAGRAPAPAPAPAASDALSGREQEVAALLVQGLSYDEIGERLCISHSTVKTHVRKIYQKTGVSGKIALISRLNPENHPKG